MTAQRLAVPIFLVLALVIVSVVPWRRGTIYAGGADAVVVAKAIVAIVALAAAVAVYSASRVKAAIGMRSLFLLLAIAAVSALGALATDDPTPSLVLVVRFLIAIATITLIVRSAPPLLVLSMLLAAMAAVAIFTAASGITASVTEGRLAGGLPEMAPNVLAGLAGPPLVGIAVHIVRQGIRFGSGSLFVLLMTIVLATGSRTSLLVVVVGIGIALLYARRVPSSVVIAGIALVTVLVALFSLTNILTQILSRGQDISEIRTFSARTVAWEAVLATPFDTWDKWIGVGLAAKTVAVQERFRDVQVLDSSWVSILAQAGIVGTVLLVIWVLATGADTLRRGPLRALTTPLLVLMFLRSFTENGLIESSSTFVLFLAIALILEPGYRYPGKHQPTAPYRLAMPMPTPTSVAQHSPDIQRAAIDRDEQ